MCPAGCGGARRGRPSGTPSVAARPPYPLPVRECGRGWEGGVNTCQGWLYYPYGTLRLRRGGVRVPTRLYKSG